MRTLHAGVLPAAAWLWVLLLLTAPIALSRGALPVGTLATYKGASILCHQKAERSFTVANAQMPVCARCFGLYLAGAVGALAAFVSRGRGVPGARAVRLMLAVAAVPMLLSVGLEWVGAIHGSNESRFISALPLGLVAGWLLERTIEGDASMSGGLDALSFRRT
jgi:uncharacterized membrane protein